jgi:hypothetical protein
LEGNLLIGCDMVQAVDKVMLNIWLRKVYGPTREQEDSEVCRKMELRMFHDIVL